MARYTYNAGLVTEALEYLNSGCNCLKNTNVDIQKGIDMINNARGAENIKIDFAPILSNQSAVIDYIEQTSKEIKNKSQEIEEYQSAPWWKKVFATLGMGALKIVEGLATFVEQIGDGLVSIVGFVGGLFSSEFSDCVGEFVKKDWVGDTAAQWYEEGWLKSVNKYSIMSHQSTAANVLKGIGTAAGYVVLTVATGGAGASSLAVAAGSAAVGGIGAGTQSGLQQGKSFNQAFGQGVKEGAVAAGVTLVTAGIAKGLSGAKMTTNGLQFFDDVVNSADDVAKLSKTAKFVNSAKKAFTTVGNKVLNNKAGLALIEGVQTVGSTGVGGALINASAPIIGANTGGQFKHATNGSVNENQPTPGEELKKETNYGSPSEHVKINTSPKASSTSADSSAQETTSVNNTKTNTGRSTSSRSNSSTSSTYKVTTPDTVKLSNTSSGNTGGSTGGSTGGTTGGSTGGTTGGSTGGTTGGSTGGTTGGSTGGTTGGSDDFVGKVSNVGGSTGGSIHTSGVKSVESTLGDKTSSDVLDTFGQAAGSLSSITGSDTSIPTSSSPILSSGSSESGKSMVPLGAGLGAAALSGIGAKAYLDKRERKEEDRDELETENWENEQDVEIDYGLEKEEVDYLNPTDELAFQE